MTNEDIKKIDLEGVRHIHVTGIPPVLSGDNEGLPNREKLQQYLEQ
jgi:hypothetical protein